MKNKIDKVSISLSERDNSNPINLGMIFDVDKDNLSKLIKFNNEQNFFKNILSKFKGEIITLINGNQNYRFYDIDSLIVEAKKSFLNDEVIIDANDEVNFIEIFKRMNFDPLLYELRDSSLVYHNYIDFRNNYMDNFDFFKDFDNLISKQSSISFPIKQIYDLFEKNYSENKYIIIISNGNSEPNIEELNNLKDIAIKNNITIITLYLSKNENIKKILYNDFPNNLFDDKLKFLFDISSKVNYRNKVARYYIKKGWKFQKNYSGTLFFETNLKELNEPYSFSQDLNEIKYEGINMKIEDLNYENLIQFKYQFFTKNQVFGTCWANAYCAGIFLTNKRIIGKKT